MKPIPYKKLRKMLLDRGCEHLRTKGSHESWRCGSCVTTVPHHTNVAPGTLRNIQENLAPCLGEKWLEEGK